MGLLAIGEDLAVREGAEEPEATYDKLDADAATPDKSCLSQSETGKFMGGLILTGHC